MEGFKIDDLCHYGIKGQKWGERRFQNKDGSLTPAGRQRYQKSKADIRQDYENLKADAKAVKFAHERWKDQYRYSDTIYYYRDKAYTNTEKELRAKFDADTEALVKKVDSFKKKYGDDELKEIDFKKTKRIASNMISYLGRTLVEKLPASNGVKRVSGSDLFKKQLKKNRDDLRAQGLYPYYEFYDV